MVTTRPMSTTNTATAVPAVNRNRPYHGYARPLTGNGIAVFFFQFSATGGTADARQTIAIRLMA